MLSGGRESERERKGERMLKREGGKVELDKAGRQDGAGLCREFRKCFLQLFCLLIN